MIRAFLICRLTVVRQGHFGEDGAATAWRLLIVPKESQLSAAPGYGASTGIVARRAGAGFASRAAKAFGPSLTALVLWLALCLTPSAILAADDQDAAAPAPLRAAYQRALIEHRATARVERLIWLVADTKQNSTSSSGSSSENNRSRTGIRSRIKKKATPKKRDRTAPVSVKKKRKKTRDRTAPVTLKKKKKEPVTTPVIQAPIKARKPTGRVTTPVAPPGKPSGKVTTPIAPPGKPTGRVTTPIVPGGKTPGAQPGGQSGSGSSCPPGMVSSGGGCSPTQSTVAPPVAPGQPPSGQTGGPDASVCMKDPSGPGCGGKGPPVVATPPPSGGTPPPSTATPPPSTAETPPPPPGGGLITVPSRCQLMPFLPGCRGGQPNCPDGQKLFEGKCQDGSSPPPAPQSQESGGSSSPPGAAMPPSPESGLLPDCAPGLAPRPDGTCGLPTIPSDCPQGQVIRLDGSCGVCPDGAFDVAGRCAASCPEGMRDLVIYYPDRVYNYCTCNNAADGRSQVLLNGVCTSEDDLTFDEAVASCEDNNQGYSPEELANKFPAFQGETTAESLCLRMFCGRLEASEKPPRCNPEPQPPAETPPPPPPQTEVQCEDDEFLIGQGGSNPHCTYSCPPYTLAHNNICLTDEETGEIPYDDFVESCSNQEGRGPNPREHCEWLVDVACRVSVTRPDVSMLLPPDSLACQERPSPENCGEGEIMVNLDAAYCVPEDRPDTVCGNTADMYDGAYGQEYYDQLCNPDAGSPPVTIYPPDPPPGTGVVQYPPPSDDGGVIGTVMRAIGAWSPIESADKPGALVAIVIGNADYKLKGMPNAPLAHADADSVAEFLQEDMGLKEDQIIVMKDAKGSDFDTLFGKEGSAKGRLREMLIPGAKNEVIFYFSGHGWSDGKNTALLPADADPKKLSETGFALTDLYRGLDALSVKRAWFVYESAFGETPGARPKRRGPKPKSVFISPQPEQKGWSVLTAGAGNQPTYYGPKGPRSPFTLALVTGLRGLADIKGEGNKDNQVTGEELIAFTRAQVARAMKSRGGGTQTPQLYGSQRQILHKY